MGYHYLSKNASNRKGMLQSVPERTDETRLQRQLYEAAKHTARAKPNWWTFVDDFRTLTMGLLSKAHANYQL